MKKLYLCFLWHMHQPWYIDPFTREFEMPWVFLHGIKDYYEMPWLVSKYKKIKATFNLVPSLIKQLQIYSENPSSCKFLNLLKKDVDKISNTEKEYLLRILFSANLTTMIKPIPRYFQIHQKYMNTQNLTNQDFLDLQVLFLLSWTGNYLRENNHYIKTLLEKGKDFTKEEKEKLINVLLNFLKEIIPYYKNLESEGKIEITTTPYYHPILPLLLNIESAKESKPDISLPKITANFKEDAVYHLNAALDEYQSIFDKKPNGLWPAEGSLSNQTLDLFIEHKIKWTATDEDVLYNVAGKRDKYKIYKYKDIYIFFRDKYLSDSIGFRYQNMNEKNAVDDFISHLRSIYNSSQHCQVVSVILDGENAWEFYKNNGKDFFNRLYSEISHQRWIECITFSEVLGKNVEIENLESIKAGSWIYGNFTTWIGHPEKNTAWEYLSETRNFLESEKENDLYKKAIEYIYIAEGSDWFWWYGDDHFTIYADKFDLLFRSNLMKVYDVFGKKPPAKLSKPIKQTFKQPIIKKPKNYITPTIDGKITNYFEWLFSGEIDLTFDLSSMNTEILLNKLYYGYDKENFYLRFDASVNQIKNDILRLNFITDKEISFSVPISNEKHTDENGVEAACEKIIEIKIPLNLLNEKKFEFYIEILKDSRLLQKLPVYSIIMLDISENFDYDWMV
ncbi:glycoside hydrolase family 57 protein [Sulfurihydrogenibium yellowstonense]|uniref:Glycoside hydrolase n=1 Tax=Sulfurihydrogenibium yellowstonense SS-5 TaxID=432331 RepID=C4FJU4_9AQUI|nr:glycoside hydrolase family 57 protein [Sulfurihydrogenibium yellowstonense]EEP60653.1 glycoside hydrolase [Sulfurihydrogenibium yellowstonense SS-5]